MEQFYFAILNSPLVLGVSLVTLTLILCRLMYRRRLREKRIMRLKPSGWGLTESELAGIEAFHSRPHFYRFDDLPSQRALRKAGKRRA